MNNARLLSSSSAASAALPVTRAAKRPSRSAQARRAATVRAGFRPWLLRDQPTQARPALAREKLPSGLLTPSRGPAATAAPDALGSTAALALPETRSRSFVLWATSQRGSEMARLAWWMGLDRRVILQSLIECFERVPKAAGLSAAGWALVRGLRAWLTGEQSLEQLVALAGRLKDPNSFFEAALAQALLAVDAAEGADRLIWALQHPSSCLSNSADGRASDVPGCADRETHPDLEDMMAAGADQVMKSLDLLAEGLNWLQLPPENSAASSPFSPAALLYQGCADALRARFSALELARGTRRPGHPIVGTAPSRSVAA